MNNADNLESTGRLRILLAEDNRVNQAVALGLLERQGHEVVVAHNGREAVALFRHQEFDLILMDVEMPEMDGLTATRVIRAREKSLGIHTPIVALTTSSNREACLQAGMDAYLSKPYRPEALRLTLDLVLNGGLA